MTRLPKFQGKLAFIGDCLKASDSQRTLPLIPVGGPVPQNRPTTKTRAATGHSNYRFAWPRTIFFTLRFLDPRGCSRGFLGACFLRDARLAVFRSSLLNALVFAIHLS
jgi:hypothetical protein